MTRLEKSRLLLAVLALLALSPLFSISMNPRVRNVPQELQEQVFVTPEETLPGLTAALVAGVGDTATKVRILHDWICDNIAYDCNVFTVGAGPQDYKSVLVKKKAICWGYSNLMYVMCQLAGIEADVVAGWSKGAGYPGYLMEETDHAWNVIKIGNRWQQVDVTWDAGYVDYLTFVKHYSTEWLNRRPEEFIYSHLPEEEQWQLLKVPRTPEQFVTEPYISGSFFEYGFSLGKRAPGYSNSLDGATTFDILQAGTGSPVYGVLYSGGVVPDAIWTERFGNRIEVTVDVPDNNEYRVNFCAEKRDKNCPPDYFYIDEFESNILPRAEEFLEQEKITQKEFDLFEHSFFKVEENGIYYYAEDLFDTTRNNAVLKVLKLVDLGPEFDEVLRFKVKAADAYAGYGAGKSRFATAYDSFARAKATHLVSPVQGTIGRGSVQKFAFASSEFSRFAIIEAGNKYVHFTKNPKTGDFELEYNVPQEGDSVFVYGSRGSGNFTTLLEFHVE